MKQFFIFRLLTILTLITLHSTLSISAYFILLLSVGLGHYALSFWYARNSAATLIKTPQQTMLFAGIVTLAILSLGFRWPSIYILFAFHHMFSEVYSAQSYYSKESNFNNRFNDIIRNIFHLLAYFMILRAIVPMKTLIYLKPYIITLIGIAGVYFYRLWKSDLQFEQKKFLMLSEILSM